MLRLSLWCVLIASLAASSVSLAPGFAVASPARSVDRAVRMIDWNQLGELSSITFAPTALVARGKGEAQVELNKGLVRIRAAFSGLPPASHLGAQYLTYVLWSITPQGRPSNLGEVIEEDNAGKVTAKSILPVFGLLVTAEPYYAVTQPSDTVVFEAVPPSAGGPSASCQLLHRAADTPGAPPPPAGDDPVSSLAIQQARRAISIARSAGAEQYARQTFQVASQLLAQAEDQEAKGVPPKTVEETAQEAAMLAEDARALAVRRQQNAARH